MRICIVIKSDAFRASAGMRIRYDRFAECLLDGDTIEAKTCDELSGVRTLDHDAYVFCKTFDIESLLFARRVRAEGKLVGQDLFDDYFSQSDDPRLEEYRDWLRAMAPVTDYAVCSTPRMVEVARPFLPGVPIVAVDDPAIGYDPLAIGALSDAKTRRAAATRTLDIVWFGIGDNPFFPVGVADLAAFEAAFMRIERRGWTVRLKLVTNARPFDRTGMAMLRAFSTKYEVVEWTEDAERAALMDATAAMLPVNAQAFSRAKSLNRAITAINAGCQVLSLGHPLYDRLGDFVYRSPEALIDDLEAGAGRIGGARMPALTDLLATLANPYAAAAAFVAPARVARLVPRAGSTGLPCLLHGRATSFAAHKLVAALKGLSIATPFCDQRWNFPLVFDVAGGSLRMRATATLVDTYELATVGRSMRIRDLDVFEIDQAALGVTPLRLFQPVPSDSIRDVVVYADVMAKIATCCRAAFGAVDLMLSDASPLKWPLALRDAAA